MNINKKKYIVLALATLPMLNSCSESWLEPKPLSFYSPENTYVNAEGLYAALTACERNMRHEYFGDGAPILTEMFLTDLAVHGKTDESASLVDLDNEMLPARTKNDMKGKNKWYWEEGFKGIKYANIAISRLDAAKYKDEAERKAVLGAAYFQRAYRYYKLTHQFGDVPYLNKEITEPKLDFYTYDRWSILEQCKKDMEYAYQWVPEVQPRGRANKDACGVLLMKFCMATGDFDRAIEVGKEVVSRHPLMTQRFTSNKTKANTNLMHDLHSVEAKVDMSNTEGIMYVVAHPSTTPLDGSNRIYTMRNGLPYWAKGGAIKTPDGKTGTAIDAQVSDQLIRNIFFKNSPLHDGAMIIRDGRIAAAGCVLPLSSNEKLPPELGTRHRAGVGMSEATDALVVIVSEESGDISVAKGGMLKRSLEVSTLDKLLRQELCDNTQPPTEDNFPAQMLKKLSGKAKEEKGYGKK